jgi:hypothetical protein
MMTNRFAALQKCCGGSISIEALEEFQQAMREYEVFMDGMRQMFAPRMRDTHDEHPPGFMELAGSGIRRVL